LFFFFFFNGSSGWPKTVFFICLILNVAFFLSATFNVLGGRSGIKKLHNHLNVLHAMLFFFFVTSALVVVSSVLRKMPFSELSTELLLYTPDTKYYTSELTDGPLPLKKELLAANSGLSLWQTENDRTYFLNSERAATQQKFWLTFLKTNTDINTTTTIPHLFPTTIAWEANTQQTTGTLNHDLVLWYQQYASAEVDYVYTWTLSCFCLFWVCFACL